MQFGILSLFLWTTLTSAQFHPNTTLPCPTTASSSVSNITAQISLTTPVASPTPITVLPTSETPNPETTATTTTTTQHRYNPIINITITAHQTPLPTPATSLAIDTRELSSGTNFPAAGSTDGATTSQEQTEPAERTTTSAGVVPATTNSAWPGDVQNSAKGVRVGGDVAASACAFVIAIAALTWAFADLD